MTRVVDLGAVEVVISMIRFQTIEAKKRTSTSDPDLRMREQRGRLTCLLFPTTSMGRTEVEEVLDLEMANRETNQVRRRSGELELYEFR